MNFELSPAAARDEHEIARAIQSVHPGASIDVDPDNGIVRVSGRLSAQEASAAFALAGIDALLLPEEDAHVSGGSTCCGGCS